MQINTGQWQIPPNQVVLDPVPMSFAPPNQTPSEPIGEFPNNANKVNKKSKRSKLNEESCSISTESKKTRKPKTDKCSTSTSSESKRQNWLPDGWTIIERVREGGKTAGLKDKYYIEPGTGKKFRSKVEVCRHLRLLHDAPKPNEKSNSPKGKDGGSSCNSLGLDKAPLEESNNNLDNQILERRPQDWQRLYRILEGRPKTEQDIWVPIEKEVFQLPYNAGTVLGFDDMKLMMNHGWLDASIICVFMLHLYKLCSQMEANRCAFLMPNSIHQGAIQNSHEGVVRYVKDAMSITAEASIQFLLAPYLQSEHWSLLLIWPRRSRAYILDLKMSDGKTPETREIYSVLNKAFEQYMGDDGSINIPRLDLQWEEPKAAKGNWECGYYVMKYMHSFVTEHQNKFPNEWFPNDLRSYTLEDVDGIASTCVVICEEYLKNA